MKFKLLALTLALALSAAPRPSAATLKPSCALFCAQVNCIPEDVCGAFVNSSGQTVCGCHPRP